MYKKALRKDLSPDLVADSSVFEVDSTRYRYASTIGDGQGFDTSGFQAVASIRVSPEYATANLANRTTLCTSATRTDVCVSTIVDTLLNSIETFSTAKADDASNCSHWTFVQDDYAARFRIDQCQERLINRTQLCFDTPATKHDHDLEPSWRRKNFKVSGGYEDVRTRLPQWDTQAGSAPCLRVRVLRGSPSPWEFRVCRT